MDRSVAGLVAAQALYFVAGLGVLAGCRSFATWAGVVRAVGLAYVLGVASVGVTATLVLVAGFGLQTPVVVVLSLGLCTLGLGVARLRGHGLPRGHGFTRPRVSRESLASAALAVLALAVIVSFYRAARHQGLVAWDAWAFWVPKAEAIYYFGGLDEQLFATLANPSYPLLIPAVQAMDFHLMGSADAATLALQYWFLLVGFVLSGWALLRPVVNGVLLWPFLALATVLPELDKRLLSPQADWPLDIFFALAAVAAARWLLTREGWLLGVYGVLLVGMLATKREGQLLAACLVAPLVAVTWRTARSSWPLLVGIAGAAYAVNLPWRFWWMHRHLSPDTPEVPFSRLPDYADRIGPGFRIVFHLLFEYDLWLLVVPLAIVAALLAIGHGEARVGLLYLGTSALAVVGFMWIIWSFPSLPLDTSQQTPIPREVGSLVLLSVLFAPLMISRALERRAGLAPAEAPS